MARGTWEKLVFAVFALVFFVCTLVVVRWTIDFVTWSAIDSGWAQAIGSVAALGVAFLIGGQQHRTALAAVEHGDKISLQRKYKAYSLVAQAAHEHAKACKRIYPDGEFSLFDHIMSQLDEPRRNLIQALEAIPVHDVGSYEAFTALVGLKISIKHLNDAVAKANIFVDSFGAMWPQNFTQPFDTGWIQLSCQNVEAHSHNLMEELAK